jgi:hypothetical protein
MSTDMRKRKVISRPASPFTLIACRTRSLFMPSRIAVLCRSSAFHLNELTCISLPVVHREYLRHSSAITQITSSSRYTSLANLINTPVAMVQLDFGHALTYYRALHAPTPLIQIFSYLCKMVLMQCKRAIKDVSCKEPMEWYLQSL